LLAGAACNEPDTVVLVLIEGQISRPIFRFQIDVTVGSQTRTYRLPKELQSMRLPASFTVRIPRDLSGALHITVAAFDDAGTEVGRGDALFVSFDVGGQNEASVTLLDPLTTGG
jgi:hypothetical protein